MPAVLTVMIGEIISDSGSDDVNPTGIYER